MNNPQGNSEASVSPAHSSDSSSRHRRALVIVILVVVILFIVLAPVVPTVAAGGYGGGHPQILGSISYVLTRGNFGFTYCNGGYYFGGPPVP
ncbi:MAG: hypothetical protein ACP5UZ_04905 [Thermoplasmata archaeon]